MEPSRSRWQVFLQVIQALATAGAIAKIVFDAVGGDFQWLYFALFAVVMVTQLLLVYLMRPRDRVTLERGSRKFAEYFVSWYQQEGDHYVYCNDLDWLKGTEQAKIVQAMADRGRKMTVCTRDSADEIAARLKGAQVSVFPVPVQAVTHAAMSLHKLDGVCTLIIRNKQGTKRSNKITFIETRNDVVVALAQDLFLSVINASMTSAPRTSDD